ncbi:MAG: T9SS type A sorting domain-containing protein [Tannerella sp.]|jgi:hypothetical protein|nr:T9SS type A sorting domain-containing protein [Tannerella sp.]
MRRKIFLSALLTGTILAGNVGIGWGQTVVAYSDDHQTHPITATSFTPDNNFAAGETGTIRPLTNGTSHPFGAAYNSWSPYAGTWTGVMGTFTLDMFNAGNGRITIGGAINTVGTGMNQPGITSVAICAYGSATNGIGIAPKPNVPDGTGSQSTNGAPPYNTPTVITVDGSSKLSASPWWLQQFWFKDIGWAYNYYTYAFVAGSSHSESFWNGVSGIGSDWCYPTHSRVQYTYTNPTATGTGAYVNGQINVDAGSNIRLDAANSIGADNPATRTSTATLNLPGTHYSLMLDGNFDAISITGPTGAIKGSISNLATLGTGAVLGIQGNFVHGGTNSISTPAATGATLLLGPSTTGQDKMVITPTTASGADAVGKGLPFSPIGYVYTGTGYFTNNSGDFTGNVGNYGANSVTLTNSATMFTSTGTKGIRNYAVNGNNCIDFIYAAGSNLTVTVNAGSWLSYAYGTLRFNNVSTFTAGSSGHVTLRGGNVEFNNAHVYNGSSTGDYWVDAVTNCRAGDILVAAAAPITVKNVGGNADLKWEADRDIVTQAIVTFQNDLGTEIDWWAGRNIDTHDTVQFINDANSTDATRWYAYNNITTNSDQHGVYNAGTGVTFTHNGADSILWRADIGSINTKNHVTFTHTASSTGNTYWEAQQNIITQRPVLFDDLGSTSSNYAKWYAIDNSIQINDSVTFNQMGTASTGVLRGTNHNITTPTPNGALWLVAGQHVLSENLSVASGNYGSGGKTTNTVEDPLLINFGATNDAPLMIHAEWGNVILDGVTHIDRQNTGASETTIEAGADIHLLDTFTINDVTTGTILLHAHQDIRTNDSTCSTDKTAPVFFTATDAAWTRLVADRNIHTVDTVKFNYASPTIGPLDIVARGGNITTDRWFGIDYRSDNTILFSAVNSMPAPLNYIYTESVADGPAPAIVNNSGTDIRNTLNGNIYLNDSVIINRTNNGNGNTNILAQHNIRTATVNYIDSLSTGNNVNIESYIGDIFLGYSITEDNICQTPAQGPGGAYFLTYDKNKLNYYVNPNNTTGKLTILSGYEDQTNTARDGGGNIYFTRINAYHELGSLHPTEISIPFTYEYTCADDPLRLLGDAGSAASRMHYEHAGIIAGVAACGLDADWSQYAPMQDPDPSGISTTPASTDTSLVFHGYDGDLLLDAGTQGNIIINQGAYLNFLEGNGNVEFRTRWGNIDMRDPFDADSLHGGLTLLASSDLPNKFQKLPGVDYCDCTEPRNNVYLQDFQYMGHTNSGSVYIGADNNIKIQYGGLKTIGSQRDPFFAPSNGYQGLNPLTGDGECGLFYHCDADTMENQARDLILNFDKDTAGNQANAGGFAAVASDLIDVYKNMVYHGGTSGGGMSAVPKYGNLHGANVAGYGLYILTQANKPNWTKNDHDVNANADPTVGAACDDEDCGDNTYLHNTARVTFHSDARIYTQAQKSYIASPVLETYGNLDLNTHLDQGSRTAITIRTDSLIMHDSLIIDGTKTTFQPWSDLPRNMPIFKLGHQRFTPPFGTASNVAGNGGVNCDNCYTHAKDEYGHGYGSPIDLDTIFVTFRYGATVPRLHTLVADHAKITFLTDSFDHQNVSPPTNNPTVHAMFKTDTFKIRNHVELFEMGSRQEYDGQLELISEEQMISKNYAGIYTRHIHFEPIAPECSDFPESQLWPKVDQMEVIPSSTLGGFGWLHASVNVQIGANLFPGFASLGVDGNCYEQFPGVLKFEDARIDHHANLKFSIGERQGHYTFENPHCPSDVLGLYADAIDVDSLTVYDEILLDIIVRSEGIELEDGDSRCFPIIHYNSVTPGALNHIKLKNDRLTSKDHPSIEQTVYMRLDYDTLCHVVRLCVATRPLPTITRQVVLTSKEGVVTDPKVGVYWVESGTSFSFKALYATKAPYIVRTDRVIEGVPEVVRSNERLATSEYVYTIPEIRSPITITFGPEFTSTVPVVGRAVWSFNDNAYIRTERDEAATIYSIAGQLVMKLKLAEGTETVHLASGVYIVAFDDGTRYKIIIR